MKRAEKQEHLLDVATELFNRLGYHATGIDQVIETSGVAKTTLYRHFESKEALIVAVLRRIDKQYRENMRAAVSKATENPKMQLLATFDYLDQWFACPDFFGCPFISAAGEYNDHSSAVFQEARVHKRLMIAYFEELARAAGITQPLQAAEDIHLLHEGATAIAHITGDAKIAGRAKEAGSRIIGASI